MSPATAILGAVIAATAVSVVVNLVSRYLDKIHERRAVMTRELEKIAASKEESARVAILPKLDTSRMLKIPMIFAQIEESQNSGGSFGNRYVHMLVTDRDGQQYFCFMTEYNMHALWRSEFRQALYTPLLTEHMPDFYIHINFPGSELIDSVRIGVHPTMLRDYQRDSQIWKDWATLHREFDDFIASGGNNHAAFAKYFEHGDPRAEPLQAVA